MKKSFGAGGKYKSHRDMRGEKNSLPEFNDSKSAGVCAWLRHTESDGRKQEVNHCARQQQVFVSFSGP